MNLCLQNINIFFLPAIVIYFMSIRYGLTYIRQIQPEKALSPSRLSDLKIAPKEVGGLFVMIIFNIS